MFFVSILAALAATPQTQHPSRALALELSQSPRLAGTIGSRTGAAVVARWLEEAGWSVELDEREVLLCYPRRSSLAIFVDASSQDPIFDTETRYDPDAIPPGDVPLYSAWSASGLVRAPVIDVGQGLRPDYETLVRSGISPRGCIALVRYGGSYRGCKVELADEFGCVGVLLHSDPASDGAAKGPTWPKGPWKPDHEAQRGSIYSVSRAPGDPSTPGWPSPAPGKAAKRLEGEALASALPRIPCTPIGARAAAQIQAHLALARVTASDGLTSQQQAIGPGPVEVRLDLDVPRTLRPIVNVIARLPGTADTLVLAGNHRDAWVRGMHDAGSGTVSMVRAAQQLGARARTGWKPRHSLVLGFWDAEEFGLIGSTEWAEAHAQTLRERALVYINADALVSGLKFGASGTPGMFGALERSLECVMFEPPAGIETVAGLPSGSIADEWRARRDRSGFTGDLPGSGSDFAVFLHHLGIPVIDLSFHGNGGGQYHTSFDDFGMVDRFLDPGWHGHELAGRMLTQLLGDLADDPAAGFDAREASAACAELARETGKDTRFQAQATVLERLAQAATELATALEQAPSAQSGPAFFAALAAPSGLAGREWFTNRLWAPGLETGYASETWPSLAAAMRNGQAEFEREVDSLKSAFERLRQSWPERVGGEAR